MGLTNHLYLFFLVAWISGLINGNPILLFANHRDVQLVEVAKSHQQTLNSSVIIPGLEYAAAVDFSYEEGVIFWSDVTQEVIKRVVFNDTRHQKTIASTNLKSPDGLAVDWIAHKLYWTDSETNRIEVSNWDGNHRKVLFWQRLDRPRAIALDPQNGYMYWTDWGEVPKIEKAGMDGNEETRSVLIDENIVWPNGLTIDYDDSKLYWADAKLSFIHSCDLDGKNRRAVVKGKLFHPFAVTLYGDYLYWTDWDTHSIHGCDKFTGTESFIVMENIYSPMDIHAYMKSRQPKGQNMCGKNNGGCSHLCLLSPTDPYYVCACPTGVRLLNDKRTCAKEAENRLLIARRRDLRQISLDTPDYTDFVLPFNNIKNAIALDYDSSTGFLYWTDDEVHTIQRALLNGSEQEILVEKNVDNPDGIAVDWIAKNLYWTDSGTNSIEVSRLNGTSRKVIVSDRLDEPRAICLDPEAGYLYWSDWSKRRPVIERAYLDGSNREVIVSDNLGWPNGLAIDLVDRRIFWGDAKTDRIEVCDMDGTNRRTLVSENLHHIFGFSLLGDYVYWTDWQERTIERVNKYTGENRSVIIEHLPDLMGLKAVGVNKNTGMNTCGVNNGDCSHLCLYRPPPLLHVCACPIGLELLKDGHTCIKPVAFLVFSNSSDICRISLEKNSQNNQPIPIQGLQKAMSIDFDIKANRIYWTDAELKRISRAYMNGSNLQHIVQFGLDFPEDMAVDWVAHNIYWADSRKNCIEVARLDGSSRKVLVWQNLNQPRALALDPPKGYMYWINWEEPSVLERANLDGTNRKVIISDIGHVQDLTIDYQDRRLYWTDIENHCIKSSKMDGSDIRIVAKSQVQKPMGLSQYQDFVYWTDIQSQTIERAIKTDGSNRSIIQGNVGPVRDILVFHDSRQEGGNACEKNNGDCTHLCMAHPLEGSKNRTRHCACPTHYTLNSNGLECSAPKDYLLLSTRNAIIRLIFNSDSADNATDYPEVLLPINTMRNVKALAYDPVGEFIYWVEKQKRQKMVKSNKRANDNGIVKMIKRAHDNGTEASTIINQGNAFNFQPYDIAIDPYARTLYWTCFKNNVINVTRIDVLNSPIGVIMSSQKRFKPRSIALYPEKGFMYYTNMLSSSPRIEKALMDGSAPTIIMKNMLGNPHSLTIDKRENKLYWADSALNRIEMSDLIGGNRIVLVDGQPGYPRGLAIFGEFLYWFDKKVVSRINKKTRSDRLWVRESKFKGLSGLIAVEHTVPTNWHPCFNNNSGCSHICFISELNRTQCSCPVGMVLQADRKTCWEPPTCNSNAFTCGNGQCIPLVWRCDLFPECDDESDEANCEYCKPSEFKCTNGKCIKKELVCDDHHDCKDGADEKNCTQKEVPGNPILLFANHRDVQLVEVAKSHQQTLNSSVIIPGLEYAAAVDFSYEEGIIFWSDVTQEVIKRVVFNDTRHQKTVASTNLKSPVGLAVDWIAHKLYWTDSETNRIEVSNWDGNHRKVLFWQRLDLPRAIALDPQNGYMYWTDWGEVPKIEKAGMDGNEETRSVLIDENIVWPNGLTIDYDDSKLYWADAKLSFIHSCDLDGRNRRAVVKGKLFHPFAVTLYGDYLYWTDWDTHSIHGCDKITGTGSFIVMENIHSPMDIRAYMKSRQPKGQNMCGKNNGGCSHLCLLSPTDPYYVCACPTGVRLLNDKRTCAKEAENRLLIARRRDLRQISLDTPDYTDFVLPFNNIKNAIALDYDSSTGFLYWTDDEVHTIQRALLNGSEQEILVEKNVDDPDGIAIDWIAKNLYWTDSGTNSIEVSRLNGTSRMVIVSDRLDEPRAICLDPEAGYLYWSDWSKRRPVIERAYLDGSNREVIVSDNLGWPNGLAIDLVDRRIFWGDAKTDRIEVCDMDGTNRRTLVSENLHHIFGFSLLGDYVYWTDWQERTIERVNKYTGENRSFIIESLPDLMGLKAVGVNKNTGMNTCGVNNGDCSHLCLYRPPPLLHVCACPIGLELLKDGHTCIKPDAFLVFSNSSDIRRISLEKNSQNNQPIPIQGVQKAMSIDFDIKANRIYWTDAELKRISRAYMNGSNLQHIIQFGLDFPEGMAVDWVTHNIYWADSGKNCIEVARSDGSSRKVLVWQNLNQPRALALDPPKGYMYWINWEEPSVLERANLDGTNRKVIISDIGHVQDLTIDYQDRRLYWTDIENHCIKSSEMDGSDIRIVAESQVQKPMGLSQYRDFVYWTDIRRQTIERAIKTDGSNRSIIQGNVGPVRDILVFHDSRQEGGNACEKNNGDCTHLCMAHPLEGSKNRTRHCACPTHYTLNSNGLECSAPKKYLLLSTRNAIIRLLFNSDSADNATDYPEVLLPINTMKNVKALAYDPVGEFIYWVEKQKRQKMIKSNKRANDNGIVKMIKRAHDNGTEASTVINQGNAFNFQPYDIAIDPYARTLYWTCFKNNVINVTRIDVLNSPIGVIMSSQKRFKPRSIALYPEKGIMYYTNMLRSSPRIEKALMDGSAPTIIMKNMLGNPHSLTIDKQENKLYWADSALNRIEMSDLIGGNRIVLVDGQPGYPRGLAIFGEFLYWFDKKVVSRIHKKTRSDRLWVRGSKFKRLSGLIAVEHTVPTNWHPCFNNNSGCSHICFISELNRTQCSCPVGMVLKTDRKTCWEPPTCNSNEFTCGNGQCIPLVWRCDQYPECDDESDEANCEQCKPSEFECTNGKCIKKELVCDDHHDCKDGADEKNCTQKEVPDYPLGIFQYPPIRRPRRRSFSDSPRRRRKSRTRS